MLLTWNPLSWKLFSRKTLSTTAAYEEAIAEAAYEEAIEKVASLIEDLEIDAVICTAVAAEFEAVETKSDKCGDMDRLAVNLMTSVSNLEVTLVDMLKSEQAEKISLIHAKYDAEMELMTVKHRLDLKQKDDQIRNITAKNAESPK